MPRGQYNRLRKPTTPSTPDDGSEALVASAPTEPAREPLRPSPRPVDHRARAKARAAELAQHGAVADADSQDRFHVPADDVPEGWDYEWKRRTVLQKEDPAYQVQLSRTGWEPVPASRHPSYMPMDGKYETIERDGMILMERPKEISDRAKAYELQKARAQVRQKEEQLNAQPAGQFGRQKSDGSSLVKVGKSYEPIPIPND